MSDFELPDFEQIDWSKLRPPLLWMGAELLREVVDRDKLRTILIAQLDFRIDTMRREIEHMEKIRHIITEE